MFSQPPAFVVDPGGMIPRPSDYESAALTD